MHIRTKRTFVALVALFYALSLLACISPGPTPVAGGKPVVQIVSPAAGAQFAPGATVTVQVMAADAQGIARVELLVDNVLVAAQSLPQPQSTYQGALVWVASTPGPHALLVRAANKAGAVSDPAVISVLVAGPGAPTTVAQPPPTQPGVPTQPAPTQPVGAPTKPAPTATKPAPTATKPPTLPPPTVPPTKPPTATKPALPQADLEIVSMSLTTGGKLELFVRNNRGDELVGRVVQVENKVKMDPGGQVGQQVGTVAQQTISARSGQTISVFVDPATSLDLTRHSYEVEVTIGPKPGDPNTYEETNPANNTKTGAWQKQAAQEHTFTAAFVPSFSGSVADNGGIATDIYPGDSWDNHRYIGFVTFNIIDLPGAATIKSAVLKLGPCTIRGNPFSDLGQLYVVYLYYGNLEASDFHLTGGEYLGSVTRCPSEELDITASVQAHKGQAYYQITLSFPVNSDFDGAADEVKYTNPTIEIVYTMP